MPAAVSFFWYESKHDICVKIENGLVPPNWVDDGDTVINLWDKPKPAVVSESAAASSDDSSDDSEVD